MLWALDAKTGKKLWHFDTVPKDLWGNPERQLGRRALVPAGLRRQGLDVRRRRQPGAVPGTEEEPWGSSRPGPNLYTDSLVKLDEKTGKIEWYHQVTPHDLYDWDFQNPPILVNAGGKELVVGGGQVRHRPRRSTRRAARSLWENAVGKHNGHDDDGLLAMRGETSKLKLPMTVYPGSLGGVIAPMSTDGNTVFVPVINNPATIVSADRTAGTGPAQRRTRRARR